MKKVLMEMEDQKNSYEQKAKESLQKVLEEKMSAEQQLQSTQVWGCWVAALGTGDPGAAPGASSTTLRTPHPQVRPSPLISLSGPWLWLSRSVKSGRASTRL